MKKFTYLLLVFSLFTNILQASVAHDFDSDGKTDFVVVRNEPTSTPNTNLLLWYVSKSSNFDLINQQWGHDVTPSVESDAPADADYDGDGKTDFAVYRISNQTQQNAYIILNSSNNTMRFENFGKAGDDYRVYGDYDGDGKADIAVYRFNPSLFIYKGSFNNPNGNLTYVAWGNGSASPFIGDFDGDGKFDFSVFYFQSNLLVIKRSSDGGVEYIRNWGLSTDQRVSGDFDGDGKTDFCVVRSNGINYEWYILERDGGGTGANPIIWGLPTDFILGTNDFDGDGKNDIGVYRDSNNTFYIRKSSDGGMISFKWGTSGDGAPYQWGLLLD